MKYVLFGLLAVTLSGCVVTSRNSEGDYTSLSILSDNLIRGDICNTFSLTEEHALLHELDNEDGEVQIKESLIEKYGRLAVIDCYGKIVDFHNSRSMHVIQEMKEVQDLSEVTPL